jgi:hypothetical protein
MAGVIAISSIAGIATLLTSNGDSNTAEGAWTNRSRISARNDASSSHER